MPADKFWKYFYEIYEVMPRQGPGQRESTERALRLLPPLTRRHRILDIGCGSGTQTIDIARATEAQIVAVDNHAPFISQLGDADARRKAVAASGYRLCLLRHDAGTLTSADAVARVPTARVLYDPT